MFCLDAVERRPKSALDTSIDIRSFPDPEASRAKGKQDHAQNPEQIREVRTPQVAQPQPLQSPACVQQEQGSMLDAAFRSGRMSARDDLCGYWPYFVRILWLAF